MPKLPSLTPQKVIRILDQKGFVLDRTKGSQKIYYHPEMKRRVKVAFHRKDLPLGTLLKILRQAGISRDEIAE